MKHPAGGRTAFLLCSLLLVLETHAAPADPRAVVREFYERYAAGDVRGAEALWVPAGTDGPLDRRHRARLQKRCMQLQSLTVDVVSEEPPVFDVSATITLRASPEGTEWLETSRSRVALQRDGDAWRIASWEPRERELAERLIAAGAAERASLLAASPELQTTTFVRLMSQRATDVFNQNQYELAYALTAETAAVAERLGDPVAMSVARSTRSIALRGRGDLEGGLEAAEESRVLAEGGGSPDALARAFLRITRARDHITGIPDPELVERVVELAEEIEEGSIVAHAALHLARAHELRGRAREAFRYAALASRYADESGEQAARTAVAVLLQGLYHGIGDGAMAGFYARKTLALAREARFEGPIAAELVTVASGVAEEGDLGAALRVLDDALAEVRSAEPRAIILHRRAAVLSEMNRPEDAERALKEAFDLTPYTMSRDQEVWLTRTAIAAARGDHETMLAHLEQARGPNLQYDRTARYYRASILYRLGHIEEARALIEEVLAEGGSVQIVDPEHSLFHGTADPIHRLLVELHVAHGDAAAALFAADEIKARELSAALAARNAAPSAAPDPPRQQALEQQIRDLNRRVATGALVGPDIAAARGQLAVARMELLDLRQRQYAAGPAEHAGHAAGICPEDLPPSLDDVTIVSYLVSYWRTIVFALGPKRGGRRELVARPIEISARDLLPRIQHLTTLVEQRNLRAPAAAEEMYELLIGPIERDIADARALCIVPDAGLWRVPFPTLGPEGGPLLIDRVPLFYAPSIAVLVAAGRARVKPDGEAPRLLAFANPSVGAETASLYRAFDADAPLGAIPETEDEVRAVARIYGKELSRVYVGKTAKEATLKEEASNFDVLHIATHGIVYDNVPMFSSLLLTASADDKEEDGVLEAREIAALALDADLAVLSACETGRANLSGSGVIGLSWAFLAAGCPTTVVSQWKAHSAATATLMVEFHRQLALGLSKPEALRQAQLALRRNPRYRHPFYWAAFMVIGRP